MYAAGGGRTHTPGKGNWILSPARLPIPPQRQAMKFCYTPFDVKGGNRI